MKTSGGDWLRILVKTIFILCYIAFMWASIHKVAYFFGNFEANNGVNAGSYALAGAFDVTALVTTIGVMFFRKSMPGYVQGILWAFIIGIVIYTFFINWEYDYHFQGMDLVLQPTGETTPVFDAQGGLHYVPVMRQNTTLLMVNPLLASGFTIFALIYSVVAEFFGSKPPTAIELQERLDYLNSVSEIQQKLQEAEAKNKKPGIIATAKEKALEVKNAVNEVTAKSEKVQSDMPPLTAEDQKEDKLNKTVVYLQQNPQATDEMLAVYLGMQRPSSARFWRLKAMMLLEQSLSEDIVTEVEKVQDQASPSTLSSLKEEAELSLYQDMVKEILPAFPQKTEEEVEMVRKEDLFLDGDKCGSLVEDMEEEDMEEFGKSDDPLDGGNDGRITDAQVDAVKVIRFRQDGTPPSSKKDPTIPLQRKFSRRKPMTVAEVATELQCTERHVRELRSNGTLSAADEDRKLITASSVKSYQAHRQRKSRSVSGSPSEEELPEQVAEYSFS